MTRLLRAHWLLVPSLALTSLVACHKSSPPPQKSVDGAQGKPSQLEPKRDLSDAQVTSAVQHVLSRDPGVDSSHIHVNATDGIVELTGSAGNLLTKQRAVRVAEAVRGVRAVSDRTVLDVRDRPDTELTRDVQTALVQDAATDPHITAHAKAGVVTLTGNVLSYQDRDLAERRAQGVLGVRQVDNEVKVQLGVARSDAQVAADVVSRLRWDALVNDGLIDVSVQGGQVTLSGKVASAAERRRASADSWVLGVNQIHDSGLVVDWSAQQNDLRKHKLVGVSDEQIASAIHDAAAYDPRVSVASMYVTVAAGRATLRGSVPTFSGRRAAEDLARHTVGVMGVQNDLAVKPTKARSDKEIREVVQSALLWDPYTYAFPIDVKASQGKVTLTGNVNSAFERAEATDIAAGVHGVKDVDDNLRVRNTELVYVYSAYLSPYGPYWTTWYPLARATARTDNQIAHDINEELLWSPFVDAQEVNVKVTNGHATLTGNVDSQSERLTATESAYEGGAVAVDNRLTVVNGS